MEATFSYPYPDPEELRTQVALFRHSLVAALASETLERGELKRTLRALARRRHKMPGTTRTRVSVATLKRWLAAYRRGGLEALKPGLRVDYGRSRVIPDACLKKAIALRREVPARTAPTLVDILSRLPGYPARGINPHTLDKVLRRLGVTRKQLRQPRKRTRRWRAEEVNDLWQGDATEGLWLPHPEEPKRRVKTQLFVWIDDVSRLVVHAEFFYDQKLPRMERTLKLALLRRGVPRRLYTDNGQVFVATQFKAALAELGIKPVRSRVGQPRGRGKVERVIQTIQEQFYPEARAAELRTLSDLNEALWAWLECIYHQRVHSETRQKPVDAWRAGISGVRPADPVKVARAFLWRARRKVSSNGFVSLLGNSYSVDVAWWGRTLELRFDPFDLSRIDVYQDSRPVARAQVRHLKRSHLLELEPLASPPPVEPSGVSFLDALRDEYRRRLAAETGEIPFRDALAPGPITPKQEEDTP